MQAFAIFAVCFLGNNNKQVTGEGGFCNNPPCPRRHGSLQWEGRNIPRRREIDNLGP